MKNYYNLEEVKTVLGRTKDEVQQLVNNDELREFRDAGKINYKVNEVLTIAQLSSSEAKSILALSEISGTKKSTGFAGMNPRDQLACLSTMVQKKIITKEQFMVLVDWILDRGGFAEELTDCQREEVVRVQFNTQLYEMTYITKPEYKQRINFDDFVRLVQPTIGF